MSSVPNLADVLEGLITEENISVFMTGGMGDFDNLFASAIRTLKRKYKNIKLFLVKPCFSVKLNINKDYYGYMYDEIIIPDVVSEVHPKSAITKRNKWMIEESDIIVCYVLRDYGGAYSALKYATKLGKKIILVSKE